MAKGINYADEIRFVNQLTLKQVNYPGLFRWAQLITEVLKCGRGSWKSQCQNFTM